MRRPALFLLLDLLACSCGPRPDASLADLASKLAAAAPEAERPRVSEDLERLLALDRQGKVGQPERRALLDLWTSARRDGVVDDDERALVLRLARDVVA